MSERIKSLEERHLETQQIFQEGLENLGFQSELALSLAENFFWLLGKEAMGFSLKVTPGETGEEVVLAMNESLPDGAVACVFNEKQELKVRTKRVIVRAATLKECRRGTEDLYSLRSIFLKTDRGGELTFHNFGGSIEIDIRSF